MEITVVQVNGKPRNAAPDDDIKVASLSGMA
jgi:hypothetical protein